MCSEIFDMKHYERCEVKGCRIQYKSNEKGVRINCENNLKEGHEEDCLPFTIFPTYNVLGEAISIS